jgi:hypothetical protein
MAGDRNVLERTGLPSRCTVQAPHWPMPHPNLVPVSASTSCKAQRSGRPAGTVTSTVFPLTTSRVTGQGWEVVFIERLSSSVDQWDIGRKRDVGGGIELLVNVKKTRNRSL